MSCLQGKIKKICQIDALKKYREITVVPKMKIMKVVIILFTIFVIGSRAHTVSESCRPRNSSWIFVSCITQFYVDTPCLVPINCDIENAPYQCPGFCDISTAVWEFPCPIVHLLVLSLFSTYL